LVGSNVYNATLAASLVTILINAALVRYVPEWIAQRRFGQYASAKNRLIENHVVLWGFGRIGSEMGTALDTFRLPYAVIEVDPDIVESLRNRAVCSIFGDAPSERVLEESNVRGAALVILTFTDTEKSLSVIRDIRRQNPTAPIMARGRTQTDHELLRQAGASEIIQPDLEASATMIRHALNYLKQPNGETSAYLKRFREALTGARSVPSDGQSTLPDVHEFEVDALALADQSLREARFRERFGVTVVAVRRGSGELFVNPEPDAVVKAGDRIRVFGLPNQIATLMSAKGDE
jgi:K+:H+ antiporter